MQIEFEAYEKRRLEEELADFDKELTTEERKERERNEKRMAALAKRKEEMVKEKQQKQQVGDGVHRRPWLSMGYRKRAQSPAHRL